VDVHAHADDSTAGSADPTPAEAAVQSSSSPSPPSPHPLPPPVEEAMEHEDASHSILVNVTPADSLVGVTISSGVHSGCVENEGDSEDLRRNELSV